MIANSRVPPAPPRHAASSGVGALQIDPPILPTNEGLDIAGGQLELRPSDERRHFSTVARVVLVLGINERGQELVRGRGSAITGEHIKGVIWISSHQRIANEHRLETPGTIELGPISSAGGCTLPLPGSSIHIRTERPEDRRAG